MTKQEFADLLAGRMVLLDGAVRAELAKRGFPTSGCKEMWLLANPSDVAMVQHAYQEAGSVIFCLPTEETNSGKLAAFGLDGEVASLNRRLAIMGKSNGGNGYCFGTLAPVDLYPELLNFKECLELYREQIAALTAGDIDGLMLAGFGDLREMRLALLAARIEAPLLPVIVSMPVEATGCSSAGVSPQSALVVAQALGADAFCCEGTCSPEQMLEWMRLLRRLAKVPIGARINALAATNGDGKSRGAISSVEFGAWAEKFADAGAALLGGGCGVTPEYIAALSCAAGGQIPTIPNPEIAEALASPVAVLVLTDAVLKAPGEYLNIEMLDASDCERVVDAAHAMGLGDKAPMYIRAAKTGVLETALGVYPGRALVDLSRFSEEDRHKAEKVAAFFGAATCN